MQMEFEGKVAGPNRYHGAAKKGKSSPRRASITNRPYHAGDTRPRPRAETRMPRRLEGTAQTDFGDRMAALRKDAGYPQRKLAAELGISQRMVAYSEGETDYPPAGILHDLAHLLGVKPVRSRTY